MRIVGSDSDNGAPPDGGWLDANRVGTAGRRSVTNALEKSQEGSEPVLVLCGLDLLA